MTPAIDKTIDGVIAAEKGYVDDPLDRGGPTKFGITQAVARANGYLGDMRDLPMPLARAIYIKRYVSEPAFDQVVAINERIGAELVDTGVNMGPATAATFLQRWLNGCNFDGSHYADLFVDGRLGAVSLQALTSFLKWRGADGATVLFRGLNDLQGARYLALAEGDRSQRAFLFGWVLNRVE